MVTESGRTYPVCKICLKKDLLGTMEDSPKRSSFFISKVPPLQMSGMIFTHKISYDPDWRQVGKTAISLQKYTAFIDDFFHIFGKTL